MKTVIAHRRRLFAHIFAGMLFLLLYTGPVSGQQESRAGITGSDRTLMPATGESSGLVGHWMFEESGGTTVVDSSPSGNHGATVGSPTRISGVQGQALRLNGSSQYAVVADTPSLRLTDQITMATWIKPEALKTQALINKASFSSVDGYELTLSSSGKSFVRFNQVPPNTPRVVNSISAYPYDGETWMHVAATYDGSVIRLYINGVHEDSLASAFSISSNTLNLGLGIQTTGPIGAYAGSLDDVRIYDRALTAAEVLSLAGHEIGATAGPGGSMTPSGTMMVPHGGAQSFTVTPDEGHHTDSILVDGVKTDSLDGYTFTNIMTDHTIGAFFSINTYAIVATAGPGGSVSPQDTIIVTHGGGQGFTVTPDEGYHTDSIVVDGVKSDSLVGYTFSGVVAGHTIEAYFSINGYTISATATAGGSMTPSGTLVVSHGGDQAFTITPGEGYHTDSVVVDGVRTDSITGYTFSNVTAGHTIGAFFSINTYAIVATAGPGGSISPPDTIIVTHGADRGFTVTPDEGYHTDSIVVDGVITDSLEAYTFTDVTTAHTIAAYFTINTYLITATSGAGGSIAPAGAVAVPHGSGQAFAVTPDGGYHTDSIVVDGIRTDSTTGYTFTDVTAGHTIAAYFSINNYVVTASSTGGGTITPSGAVGVSHGQTLVFTVTPGAGHHTDSIVVDGVRTDSLTGYTFTNITGGHTIDAYFSIDTYTITATAGTGGAITPSGAVSVDHGGTLAFVVTPDEGSHIDSIVVDGVKTDSITGYTFSGVVAGHTIEAFFSINVYTITATSGAGGTVSPSGTIDVPHGGTQAFIVSPDAGYHADSIMVDAVKTDSLDGYTFSGVSANHTLSVSFSENTEHRDLAIREGWNLFSLPMDMGGDVIKNALLPEALTVAYCYETIGGYEVEDTLEFGCSYFVRMPGDGMVGLEGIPRTEAVIDVVEGWNMIGALSEPAPVRMTVSDPPGIVTSEFFGYAGKYHVADTLEPGRGYWVKVAQGGTLTISADGASFNPAQRIRLGGLDGQPPPPPGGDRAEGIPVTYGIDPPYPNPFNPSTLLRYQLPLESRVSIIVYNIVGQVVAVLVDGVESAGYKTVEWNAYAVPSGVYFCRFSAMNITDPGESHVRTSKMIVVK